MANYNANQDDEAKQKKARNVRCIFSLLMGLMCLIALFFPLFRINLFEAGKYYFVENGLDMMYFNSSFLITYLAYLSPLFGLLCWLQFIFAVAAIIMSAIAMFKFSTKSMRTITLILSLISLFFMFAYMLEGCITCLVKNSDYEMTAFLTFSYIPFILGAIIFGVGLILRAKNKMPVEEKQYQQAMNYGMADENVNYNNYSNANMNSNANNYSNANVNNNASANVNNNASANVNNNVNNNANNYSNYVVAGAANMSGGGIGASVNMGNLLDIKQKKARNVRCFFSLAMGIICLIALLFPLFIYGKVVYISYLNPTLEPVVENGFTLMFFSSRLFNDEFLFLAIILGLLCWLQFFIAIATIIISIVGIVKSFNKAMNIITLILPIISLFSIFLYMLQGSIVALVLILDGDSMLTLSFTPFLLAIPVFVVGLVLRFKTKMPAEENRYQRAMRYAMADENMNNGNAYHYSNYAVPGAANMSGGGTGTNRNNGNTPFDAQMQSQAFVKTPDPLSSPASNQNTETPMLEDNIYKTSDDV